MDIREPVPDVNEIPELTDPGRTLGFVQGFGEIFRELGDSGIALVCSQITSVADPDEVSVMAYGSRQEPEGSLILGVVE